MVTLNEYGYHFIRAFRRNPEVGKITVLCPRLPKGESYTAYAEPGIELLPCWDFNSVFAAFQIRQQMRNIQADALIFNLQFMTFGEGKVPAALGLLAPWLCRRKHMPVITLLHNITETVKLENIGLSRGGLAAKLMLRIGRILTRFILKSDLVGLTISQYVDIIRREYKVKHAVLLPHGSFDLPARVQQADKPEVFHLLAFGKFGTYKKAEVLLEALPILRQRYPQQQFRVTIAGTDNPNVKGYIARLEKEYEHDPDVVFTGYVPEEAVEALFQSATLIVFPYTATTGSSGILHQAGSYARACVLPNMDDLARVVEEEGYTGEYFETAKPFSLANAIGQLLENPERRKAMEEANYRAAAALSMDDLVHWYLGHLSALQAPTPGVEVSFMGKNIPSRYAPIRLNNRSENQPFQLGYALWTDINGSGNWIILRLSGFYCAAAVPDFTALYTTLKLPGCSGVYLDMRNVEHVDLLGLNELIRMQRNLQKQGARLRILCSEDSEVYRWLQQSGLAFFIPVARIENAVSFEKIDHRNQQPEGEKCVQPGAEEMKYIVPDETGFRDKLSPQVPGNRPV
jgi:anti-anti-sigma factor